MTAGAHNSAYFEPAFLAQQMASNWSRADSVDPVRDEAVFNATTQGRHRVDVNLPPNRLIDGRCSSIPWSSGLSPCRACRIVDRDRAGRITIANAIVPALATINPLSHTCRNDPFISANRPSSSTCTLMLRKKERLEYVLAHLAELVVKELHGARRLPCSRSRFHQGRDRGVPSSYHATPERYIAQAPLALSTCPVSRGSPCAAAHRSSPPSF